jgi:hypothetical protein
VAVRSAFVHGAVPAGARVVILAEHLADDGDRFPTVRVAQVGEDGRLCEL